MGVFTFSFWTQILIPRQNTFYYDSWVSVSYGDELIR